MTVFSSSFLWMNSRTQLSLFVCRALSVISRSLSCFSNPSGLTPERRISASGFGNKVLSKEVEEEEEEAWRKEDWRGMKWKRWFNFHCDTVIFKAPACENHKPLWKKRKKRGKRARSCFTTSFIREQKDEGERERWMKSSVLLHPLIQLCTLLL